MKTEVTNTKTEDVVKLIAALNAQGYESYLKGRGNGIDLVIHLPLERFE